VHEVRIVGGDAPDALLLAVRAAQTPVTVVPGIPGTRILREPISAAQAALSAV
jgi:hypothetical protein